jgi:dipeptidyl aminopeptidase/acylaminoacyl peptidase
MAMRLNFGLALLLAATATTVQAQKAAQFDAAAAFGARPSVADLTLSPDGKRVAYIAPAAGQGAVLYTVGLEKDARPNAVTHTDGKPDRLGRCSWVANDRLVCIVYGVIKNPLMGLLPWTRLIAIDADGKNLKLLSTQQNEYSRGWQLGGGTVLDWLPDENGSVLMTRHYLPDDHLGSHLGSSDEGLGVDRIDTRTLEVSHVERPARSATDYITDGRGTVRIMAMRVTSSGDQDTGVTHYHYRLGNSRDWRSLSEFNSLTGEGFRPIAVDHDLNVAYGLKKKDGRMALFAVSLDEALQEKLVYSRPDVDIDSLLQIGRQQRVVAASYATDTRHAEYLTSDKQMLTALSKALPDAQLRIADSSTDESKMLLFAGSDTDPGVYYIFDRKARQLNTFYVARDAMEGVKLARMKPVSYPSGDGVMVPGYLTLPPGREDGKGLPAIVLPHGGPSARDEWGFDWLSQFFANRGFAVIQPNFRGSSGYGDAWFQQNGFRSWPVAINDVLAAGRWLVSQGIADPSKLAVVGWSYGGYAALQSAVVNPETFKAVIAIAPVTDLSAFKEEARNFTHFSVVQQFVGEGPHMHEGSPIEHADKIKVPVLLFHGAMDRNVGIAESQRMAEKLKKAGARCELVTWDNLDHYLEDSAARTQMLSKSDAFLRQALGM